MDIKKNDTISRQAAIDAIRRLPNAGMHWFISAEAVLKVLSEMPPAEPPWIPLSEKSPRGQTQVIISGYDDSGDTPFDYTAYGWMTRDGKYWIVDNDIDNFVVAWMPMPRPYRKEK